MGPKYLLLARQQVAWLLSVALALTSALFLLPRLVPPAHGTSPGYNGKIAFRSLRDGNREVYVMNADGSNQVNLSNNPAADGNPYWSPDGSKIVFTSDRDGNNEIYTMNANGSNVTRLTNNSAHDGIPSFSSDGTKITFVSSRSGNQEFWIMNADGSSQTQLTTIGAVTVGDPMWSPDGQTIAYMTNKVFGGGNYEMYTMNFDGSNQVRITNNAFEDRAPTWSPDGSRIAFFSRRDHSSGEVYTMDPDGSDVLRLTADTTSDYAPSWSADGSKIAITSGRSGADQIWVMNQDGSGPVRLTTSGVTDDWPQWQPIPNVAPVSTADTLAVAYQTAGSTSVLSNDTDEETLVSSNLTISSSPSHGTASVNTPQAKIEYTPANGYSGSDSLTYRICDIFALDQKCSTAVLGISVGAPGAPSLTISKVDGQSTNPGGSVTSATAKPNFSGTSSPGADIRIEIHSDPIILTTTADSSGNWSVEPSTSLPPGQHTVTISASLNGQTTTLDSFVLGISAELPQAGAEMLYSQVLGTTMTFMGYGLYVFDKRRRIRRHIQPALNSVK